MISHTHTWLAVCIIILSGLLVSLFQFFNVLLIFTNTNVISYFCCVVKCPKVACRSDTKLGVFFIFFMVFSFKQWENQTNFVITCYAYAYSLVYSLVCLSFYKWILLYTHTFDSEHLSRLPYNNNGTLQKWKTLVINSYRNRKITDLSSR